MATDPLPDYLREYQDSLVPARPKEMVAMEAYAKENRFPIIGPASGYFCYQVARILGATRIFELGSGYGYSTAWFAKAVQENIANGASAEGAVVHHVVWDEGLSQMAKKHLAVLGFEGLIQYRMSEAIAALRETEGPFDLIFNDIDKQAYPESIPFIKEKLRPGGALLIDNMLWHGAIFDKSDDSPANKGVLEATRMLTTDPDFISTLIPVRDGVICAVKK